MAPLVEGLLRIFLKLGWKETFLSYELRLRNHLVYLGLSTQNINWGRDLEGFNVDKLFFLKPE